MITVDDKDKIEMIESMDAYKRCMALSCKIMDIFLGENYNIAFGSILSVMKSFILKQHFDGIKPWQEVMEGCMNAMKADIEFSLEEIRRKAN